MMSNSISIPSDMTDENTDFEMHWVKLGKVRDLLPSTCQEALDEKTQRMDPSQKIHRSDQTESESESVA